MMVTMAMMNDDECGGVVVRCDDDDG